MPKLQLTTYKNVPANSSNINEALDCIGKTFKCVTATLEADEKTLEITFEFELFETIEFVQIGFATDIPEEANDEYLDMLKASKELGLGDSE